jgi:hypothetical protein
LQLEILALGHQINVLRRSQRGRAQLSTADGLLWISLMRLWSSGGGRLVFAVEEDGGGVLGLEEAGSSAGRRRKEEPEDRASRVV